MTTNLEANSSFYWVSQISESMSHNFILNEWKQCFQVIGLKKYKNICIQNDYASYKYYYKQIIKLN